MGLKWSQEAYNFNSDSDYLCDVEQVKVFPVLHCSYTSLERDLE